MKRCSKWNSNHKTHRNTDDVWRQAAPWGPRAFFGAAAVDKHVLVFGGIRTPEVGFSKEISCTHHRWNIMEHAGFQG